MLEDLFVRHPIRNHADHDAYWDAQATDAWHATHLVRFDSNACVLHRYTVRMCTASAAGSPFTMPPPFSVIPTFGFLTWRSPASPRSCVKIS
jgi:hypothetical protein